MVDENYMQRCIDIAIKGLGNVAPNPLVGSVIVHNDKIIGEGYHQKYGGPHAEINAINSVKDISLLKDSKLFVNLEPCSHFGKTPPCTDKIIEFQIPEVIIGCLDSYNETAGNGIKTLKEAGCKVTQGVLENEAREINKRFFTFHEKKRPYIILKWAQTLDGFIDVIRIKNTPIQPFWITNELARITVHKWRSEEQAIMVGTNTAENDNPRLNVREWSGNQPIRIVLDRNLRLPKNLNLFDGSSPTIVFTEKTEISKNNLEFIQYNFDKRLIPGMLNILWERQVQSIIIEGGARLINSFINLDLWDEARMFTGNIFFHNGIKAPVIDSKPFKEEKFQDSKLFYFKNN